MRALIVCATYGRIPFLNRMLASFMSQTYEDKHLVIVNDDKNVTLCCEQKNVTVVNMTSRVLLPNKRNIGTTVQYSDMIMHLDDDDIFLPKRIENHVKIHQLHPNINMYFNRSSYVIYGNDFSVATCSPTANSHLTKAWFSSGGYKHLENDGEDTAFAASMLNKLIVKDENQLDFVYNYGGINYHTSGAAPSTLEHIAYKQLKRLDLIGKKYYIEPDFEEFNKFVTLADRFDKTKTPITVKHTSFGKIDIPL